MDEPILSQPTLMDTPRPDPSDNGRVTKYREVIQFIDETRMSLLQICKQVKTLPADMDDVAADSRSGRHIAAEHLFPHHRSWKKVCRLLNAKTHDGILHRRLYSLWVSLDLPIWEWVGNEWDATLGRTRYYPTTRSMTEDLHRYKTTDYSVVPDK